MKTHQKFWMIASNTFVLTLFGLIAGMIQLWKFNPNAAYFVFAVLVLAVMFALSNLKGD